MTSVAVVIGIRENVFFTRWVGRFDDIRGGAAKAEEAMQKVAVSSAQALVGEAVDEEINAGVQVRDHWCEQVNGEREHVVFVRQQNNCIRRPAYAESDEDDEDHSNLADRLHNRRLGGPHS